MQSRWPCASLIANSMPLMSLTASDGLWVTPVVPSGFVQCQRFSALFFLSFDAFVFCAAQWFVQFNPNQWSLKQECRVSFWQSRCKCVYCRLLDEGNSYHQLSLLRTLPPLFTAWRLAFECCSPSLRACWLEAYCSKIAVWIWNLNFCSLPWAKSHCLRMEDSVYVFIWLLKTKQRFDHLWFLTAEHRSSTERARVATRFSALSRWLATCMNWHLMAKAIQSF